jgi:hypothetical protein
MKPLRKYEPRNNNVKTTPEMTRILVPEEKNKEDKS